MHATCTCFQTLYQHQLWDKTWNNSPGISGFPSTLDCDLVFAQVDKHGSQTSLIWDACEEKFGSKAPRSVFIWLPKHPDIRHAKEVPHVMQTIGLGIRMRQLHISFPARFWLYSTSKSSKLLAAAPCNLPSLASYRFERPNQQKTARGVCSDRLWSRKCHPKGRVTDTRRWLC